MSKLYSALTGFCLSVLALGSQPALAQVVPPHRTCATQAADDRQQEILTRTIPGYSSAKMVGRDPSTLRTTATTYTLPVVVHVINNGEAIGTGTNISHAQIQSQIDVLNEDYRKMNADGSIVPTAFQALRGDGQFQFVAANIDPTGKCMAEPGVDRVNRNTKKWTAPPYSDTYTDATIKPGSYWDPTKYVNIWVMNLSGGLLGYAQFPNNTANLGGLSANGGSASTDGVVILYTSFGRMGNVTSPYNKGRSLTHELGHWLGLRHIWGDSGCGNDYCADTPTQSTSNFGCPTFPHVTCSNGTNGDMFMNYMDYVDDGCMEMFSPNQTARMQAVMAANTARRTSLATAAVYTTNATITNPGVACLGSSLTLTANGPTGATYAWTGPSGFTSTDQSPTLANITAAMAGAYSVTVTTTGVCSSIINTTVIVSPVPATPALATSATTVCPGSTAVLSASNLPGTGATPVYAWTLVSGDGLPAATNTATLTVAPTVASVYRLTVNYTGAPCTSTSTVNVGVNAAPPTPVLASSATTVCPGSTAVLSATNLPGTGGTPTYAWTLVSGNGLPTATNIATLTVSPTVASVYRLTVKYTGSTCTSTSTVSVGVGAGTNTITAGNSGASCPGSDIILNANTLTGAAYAWAGPNGFASTLQNPVLSNVTAAMAGTYTVTVTGVTGLCTNTSSTTVAVSAVPPTPVLASTATTLCAGSSAVLSATNLTGTPVYAWTLVSGDGLPIATNNATLTVAPTVSSVYQLTVNYTGSTCTSASTVNVAVSPITPVPVLASSAAAPICAGTTAVLSASNLANLATTPTYAWALVSGDGLPTTTTTATLNVLPTVSSVYSLTVNYPGSTCTSTSTVSVAVSPVPPTPTLASSVSAPICAGATAVLSASNLANLATTPTYAWMLVSGDGLPSAVNTATLSVLPTVSSVYRLTVNYPGSTCTSTATVSVAVNPVPPTPVLVSSANAICAGTIVGLSATNLSGLATTPTYTWALVSGNGLPATTNTATIAVTPTVSSVYSLAVNYPGSPCTTVSTVSVTVSPVPPTPVLATSSASVCPATMAVLTAPNLANLGTTPVYSWTLVSGDGLPAVTNTASLSVTPTVASVYRLTVNYPGSTCTTTSTVAVGISMPVWTGAAGNGNWFDASNWKGCVPTRNVDATIPSGLLSYPTIASGTAEVRTLTQHGSLAQTGGELAIYGDYLGAAPLGQSGGVLATRGTGSQDLRSSSEQLIQNLVVGGTGTKTIGTATIRQALTLAGGVLNTGTTTVTLASVATITETDASYVVGKVQTTHTVGASPDTFGGLGLNLSPAAALGTTVVVRTTGQTPSAGTGTGISRYYDITPAVSRGLQGATIALSYLPHELNGLAESQLVLFKSADTGATWSNEGATTHDTGAKLVSRNYVTDLQGRWTLGSATAALKPAAIVYAISAFPVPFTANGVSLQVTTPTAGPLNVKIYDILGRVVYDQSIANVEVGTSTVALPGAGMLRPAKYIMVVQQANQEANLQVVRTAE